MQSEDENKSLNSKLSDYETLSADLKHSLSNEKEAYQQTSQSMTDELDAVRGQLGEVQANAASLDQKNQVQQLNLLHCLICVCSTYQIYLYQHFCFIHYYQRTSVRLYVIPYS